MRIKCFWFSPTDQVRVWIRWYRPECPQVKGRTCEASCTILEEAPEADWGEYRPAPWKTATQAPERIWYTKSERLAEFADLWQTMRCNTCGTPATEEGHRQLWAEHCYTGAPDGRLYTLRNAPPGALFDCTWYPRRRPFTGPDGIALCLQMPSPVGWYWHIDGRASNCTKKDDPEHYCWCRHGDPRTGNVYVDKAGYPTCAAGAGSIQTPTWHGFLRAGGWLSE